MGDFNCNIKTGDFTICVPEYYHRKNDQRIFINLTAPAEDDSAYIRSIFARQDLTPVKVNEPPKGLPVESSARLYDITNFLPQFIRENAGGGNNYIGPNCYSAALAASGFFEFADRHVGTDEFEYYLNLLFKKDYDKCFGSPGGILLYEDGPGFHAAVLVASGLVFQKGSYDTYFPYEIVGYDQAMASIEKRVRRGPFDGKPNLAAREPKYCYTKITPPVITNVRNDADRARYLPLFNYYISRFEKVMKFTGGDVRKNRIDVLTIQNMYNVKIDFREKRIGMIDTRKKMMTLDTEVVKAFLKLDSLALQYESQTAKYDSPREGLPRPFVDAFFVDLYRDHYVNFDINFFTEASLLLDFKGVPKKDRSCVVKKLIEEIKDADLADLAVRRFPFPYFKTIDSAVHECSEQNIE